MKHLPTTVLPNNTTVNDHASIDSFSEVAQAHTVVNNGQTPKRYKKLNIPAGKSVSVVDLQDQQETDLSLPVEQVTGDNECVDTISNVAGSSKSKELLY